MSDRELLLAAHLYYTEGLTQEQIAQELGMNRVAVGRLLSTATRRRIVEFHIHHPDYRLREIEFAIQRKYNLRRVYVCPSEDTMQGASARNSALQHLAMAGAFIEFMTSLKLAGETVVLGDHPVIRSATRQTHLGWAKAIHLISLNGMSRSEIDDETRSGDLHHFAKTGGGMYSSLPAPALVSDAEVRGKLENNAVLEVLIKKSQEARVVVAGLFSHDSEYSLVTQGDLTADEILLLKKHDSVGELSRHFLDSRGQLAAKELEDRTIGLTLEDIASKEWSVGVASGLDQEEITKAVLRNGWLNCLIVDQNLADRLLE